VADDWTVSKFQNHYWLNALIVHSSKDDSGDIEKIGVCIYRGLDQFEMPRESLRSSIIIFIKSVDCEALLQPFYLLSQTLFIPGLPTVRLA
jgi:hypothetical protein